MRVVLLAEQLLYHSPGGIGAYTAQLMAGLESSEGDVVIPVVARHSRDEIIAAFKAAGLGARMIDRTVVLRLPRPVLYETWTSRRGWPRLAGLENVDVVHAPSVAVPPKPRVPLVVSVHDAAAEIHPEAFPGRGLHFHHRAMEAVARRADLVIAGTASAAEDIAAHSKIEAERIRVVPYGVAAVAVSDADVHRVRRAHGLEDRRYVLWVGSLEPRKGVGTLVAAMAQLRRKRPEIDVDVVLAGYAGWLGEDLVSAADRAALGTSLHQLGRVDRVELWSLYKGATVFAFPSWYEGFGLPVVEAMTQGVPVVASDIAAIREVTAGAAVLAAPRDVSAWTDGIGSLLSDEGVARQVGEAGRTRSGHFRVESAMTATKAVYTEVGVG